MRVFYTQPLLQIVQGTDGLLIVSGRLRNEITADDEVALKELPSIVVTQFNTFATTASETIDYASEPIVYMPDEFTFHLDVESLGRLAREMLIRMLPHYAAIWESKDRPIAELWIGGKGEALKKDKQSALRQEIHKVWALPVQGRIFVVDRASLRNEFQRGGTDEAIRLAGGIVRGEVTTDCDYYVTDRHEAAEAARRQGVKQIIDTLTLTLMIGTRD